MSKLVKAVVETREENKIEKSMASKKAVYNYMDGISYEVNPLLTLKMVTASSIFGEPQYYRKGEFAEKGVLDDAIYQLSGLFAPYAIILTKDDDVEQKTTSEIMEEIIDKALSFDFDATLKWAVELRTAYNMRLNPQVIMVRAAVHPGRPSFMAKNPGVFDALQQLVMARADEPASQLAYYLYKNKSISKLPNPLKKSWAKKLASLTRYEFGKYKNKGLGLIDVVRISHAKGELVDELLKTGTISVSESEQTWESLKSQGKTWGEILAVTHVPHMALLRNLRGIFAEIGDSQAKDGVLNSLIKGVKNGKQFPFAYKTAADVLRRETSLASDYDKIRKTLNECVNLSTAEMPKLKGKTMCLSDNSGSAHGAFTSEFGTVSVANIDNLSSVIAAKNSDEGYVGVFGDRLTIIPVNDQDDVIDKAEEADQKGREVGGGTENGVWIFFDNAIKNKEHWDTVLLFSDEQAGHGGLYGVNPSQYREFCTNGRYIDVAALIDAYRKKVNPKVNVFCVQTAGYTNVLLPEYGYRTNILYGWTGKELLFVDKMIKLWDEYDTQAQSNQ